jgi:hypothetical protein
MAPSVGVCMANGLPVQSVASAMLASALPLPPAAMQGHVMPSFPHTLSGLGPFADLGCQIVFSKHAVLVIHPDGHSILDGWREQDSPRLWRFPLKATMPILPEFANYKKPAPRESTADFKRPSTSPPQATKPNLLVSALSEKYEEPGPRGNAANFLVPPPTDPIQCPTALPLPPWARPLTATPPAQPHPSQGCLAINQEGTACSVTYMYGAAQALALAAQSTKTPFDPQSLDLPSIGALVGFYHACLGLPAKQTWLDAIKASNCDSFDGLTYSNVARFCPDADETILGHLAQQRQNVRSTKPHPPALNFALLLPAIAPKVPELPSNEVHIRVVPISKLYTDDTGCFPVKARSGNQYVMIACHANGNLILQQAFKTRSDKHRIAAYNSIMTCCAARGLSVNLQILDNEASAAYKQAITFTWQSKFQLVPPEMHHCNRAERAIRTFKDHFLSILAGVDQSFPPYLWDLLLPYAEITLNLLRQSTLNPRILAWEFFHGPFDFNKTPLALVGCRVLIHAKPSPADHGISV